MYAFIFAFFHMLMRLISMIEIQYRKFMRELGYPIYYKFFIGTPYDDSSVMYYVKNGLRNGDEDDPPSEFDIIVKKYDNGTRLFKNEPFEFNKNLPVSITDNDVSSWKFINIELHINNKSMKIELSKENMYNYYIVGNIIDNSSLKFILHEHYWSEFQEVFNNNINFEQDYMLHIIDHDVNIIQVTNKSQIIIEKNGYNVL